MQLIIWVIFNMVMPLLLSTIVYSNHRPQGKAWITWCAAFILLASPPSKSLSVLPVLHLNLRNIGYLPTCVFPLTVLLPAVILCLESFDSPAMHWPLRCDSLLAVGSSWVPGWALEQQLPLLMRDPLWMCLMSVCPKHQGAKHIGSYLIDVGWISEWKFKMALFTGQ